MLSLPDIETLLLRRGHEQYSGYLQALSADSRRSLALHRPSWGGPVTDGF